MSLTEGQTFGRERGFRRPDHSYQGEMKWWIVSVQGHGAIAHGAEFLYIEEIVDTATVGPVALYRQWVVDPDGAIYESDGTPRRKELCFRATKDLLTEIGVMKMEEC